MNTSIANKHQDPYLTWTSIKKTDSEISDDEDVELEAESLYERVAALKDMIPPSARLTVSNTVSSITDLTKASFSFSGKALWIISTSAFLLGVPFALAYAEEEQYIQMEREQGMIKGANEVRVLCFLLLCFLGFYQDCYNYLQSPIRAVIRTIDTVYIASGIGISATFKILLFSQHYHHMSFSRSSASLCKPILIIIPTRRCSPPAPKPRRWLNPLCKLIPLRKAESLANDPATRLSTTRLGLCKQHTQADVDAILLHPANHPFFWPDLKIQDYKHTERVGFPIHFLS